MDVATNQNPTDDLTYATVKVRRVQELVSPLTIGGVSARFLNAHWLQGALGDTGWKRPLAFLRMLREYEVRHVFGLSGETTLNLYRDWRDFPDVSHVLARDERSASFMADAYARTSFKLGVCEASLGTMRSILCLASATPCLDDSTTQQNPKKAAELGVEHVY